MMLLLGRGVVVVVVVAGQRDRRWEVGDRQGRCR